MRFAKRLLMGAGAVALAAMVLSVTAPKVVRATVSALVQVTNTSSSPVPVAAVPVVGAAADGALDALPAGALAAGLDGADLRLSGAGAGPSIT